MSWVSNIDLFLYINLLDRKDRDREMKEVLIEQLKIPKHKIHRINAVRKKPGFEGCTRSHILALEYAIEAKVKNVCILEDDFMLTVSPEIFHRQVSTAWSFLKKFDILFLTMTPILLEATKIQPLYRVKQALAMPAMIIHQSYFSKLKYIYELALKEKIPHDLVTQRYQKNDLWYGIYPAIARQRPGFSDIEGRNVDYKYLDVDGKMLQMIDMSQAPELSITTPKKEITDTMKTMFGTLIKRS